MSDQSARQNAQFTEGESNWHCNRCCQALIAVYLMLTDGPAWPARGGDEGVRIHVFIGERVASGGELDHHQATSVDVELESFW